MQFLLIVKSVLQRKSRLNQRIGQLLQSCIIFADTKIQSTIKQIFCGRDAAKAKIAKLDVRALYENKMQFMLSLGRDKQAILWQQAIKQLFKPCAHSGRIRFFFNISQINNCNGIAGSSKSQQVGLLLYFAFPMQASGHNGIKHRCDPAFHIKIEGSLPIQFLFTAFNGINNLIHVPGFSNIIANAILNSLLGVRKIRKGCQQNDLNLQL